MIEDLWIRVFHYVPNLNQMRLVSKECNNVCQHIRKTGKHQSIFEKRLFYWMTIKNNTQLIKIDNENVAFIRLKFHSKFLIYFGVVETKRDGLKYYVLSKNSSPGALNDLVAIKQMRIIHEMKDFQLCEIIKRFTIKETDEGFHVSHNGYFSTFETGESFDLNNLNNLNQIAISDSTVSPRICVKLDENNSIQGGINYLRWTTDGKTLHELLGSSSTSTQIFFTPAKIYKVFQLFYDSTSETVGLLMNSTNGLTIIVVSIFPQLLDTDSTIGDRMNKLDKINHRNTRSIQGAFGNERSFIKFINMNLPSSFVSKKSKVSQINDDGLFYIINNGDVFSFNVYDGSIIFKTIVIVKSIAIFCPILNDVYYFDSSSTRLLQPQSKTKTINDDDFVPPPPGFGSAIGAAVILGMMIFVVVSIIKND